MTKAKFFLGVFLIVFNFLTCISQNLQKPSPSEIKQSPQWAQLMYSENPSVFEVDNLYRGFYLKNSFQKTYHTQYYKRWRRKFLNYTDQNGFIHLPNESELQSDETAYRKKQSSVKSSNWSIVGPITNYQEGGNQGSGQTNVYCVDQCLNSPSVLYCGTEPGEVYKSLDEGINWDLVSKN